MRHPHEKEHAVVPTRVAGGVARVSAPGVLEPGTGYVACAEPGIEPDGLMDVHAHMYAYVTSDFSVANVATNSHSTKPLIYKMAGVWGNHEGSMLLWVLILALFGAAVALFGNNLPPTLKARVLSVQASIAVAFLLFSLLTSNPFVRLIRRRRWQRSQSDPAGPGARLPSAVPLHGLCRLLDRLFLRDRGADRRPHRCGLGALGAALDARRLDVPDDRHRDGLVVGLLRTRLGRLVVLGSGRERLLHAVARGNRAAAFGARHGKARGAQDLDHSARDPDVLAVADRHVPRALRRADFGARVRRRSDARHLHSRHSDAVHRRRPGAVRAARPHHAAGRPVAADQPRGQPRPQQRAAGDGAARRCSSARSIRWCSKR